MQFDRDVKTRIYWLGVLVFVALMVLLYVSKQGSLVIVQSSSEDKIVKIHVEIPRLRNLKSVAFEQDINEEIESKIRQFVQQIKSTSQEDFKSGIQRFPYEAYVKTQLRYNDGKIISFVVYYYGYTGGAHGSTIFDTYNIDIENLRVLKLYDIIQEDAEKVVKQEIVRQIEERKSDFFEDATATVFSKDISTMRFVISKEGITFIFDQYELAPYSTGMPEFVLPWSILDGFLKININDNF
ncbi:MAG: DUF3298 and DUF4163 domain-containing protein [Fervidobacterium sp.]